MTVTTAKIWKHQIFAGEWVKFLLQILLHSKNVSIFVQKINVKQESPPCYPVGVVSSSHRGLPLPATP